MTPIKAISAAIISAAMTASSAADAAIRCQDAPESVQPGVYWSWREIEGKLCWFISVRGAMPPKSAFTWAIEESTSEKDVAAAPEKTKTGPAIQMFRVKPDEELSDVRANWLDDAPVDLMVGEDLWGTFGVGGQGSFPHTMQQPAREPFSEGGSRRRGSPGQDAMSFLDTPSRRQPFGLIDTASDGHFGVGNTLAFYKLKSLSALPGLSRRSRTCVWPQTRHRDRP